MGTSVLWSTRKTTDIEFEPACPCRHVFSIQKKVLRWAAFSKLNEDKMRNIFDTLYQNCLATVERENLSSSL